MFVLQIYTQKPPFPKKTGYNNVTFFAKEQNYQTLQRMQDCFFCPAFRRFYWIGSVSDHWWLVKSFFILFIVFISVQRFFFFLLSSICAHIIFIRGTMITVSQERIVRRCEWWKYLQELPKAIPYIGCWLLALLKWHALRYIMTYLCTMRRMRQQKQRHVTMRNLLLWQSMAAIKSIAKDNYVIKSIVKDNDVIKSIVMDNCVIKKRERKTKKKKQKRKIPPCTP